MDLTDYFLNKTYPSALPPLIPLNIERLPPPSTIVWHHDIGILSIIIWIILAIFTCVLLWRVYSARAYLRKHCYFWNRARSSNGEHKEDLSVESTIQVETEEVKSNAQDFVFAP